MKTKKQGDLLKYAKAVNKREQRWDNLLKECFDLSTEGFTEIVWYLGCINCKFDDERAPGVLRGLGLLAGGLREFYKVNGEICGQAFSDQRELEELAKKAKEAA